MEGSADNAPCKAGEGCCCSTLSDLAVVRMGWDGLDERVFATLERVLDHGGDLWWLYLSQCSICAQHWMIAQEERIYDDYFLRRLDAAQAQAIIAHARWPDEFITYERVLKLGRTLSSPYTYVEALSPGLVDTAKDLRRARPEITVEEIADLLGISPRHAARLLGIGRWKWPWR